MSAACGTRPPRPVDIEAADVCAFCKMAISEKRFAAEVIDRDGTVFKLDDIGCMIRFIRERGLKDKVAAIFVSDYDDKSWLEAERASYVKSAEIQSPMASGLIALRNQSRAAEYCARYNGRLLTFDELQRQ